MVTQFWFWVFNLKLRVGRNGEKLFTKWISFEILSKEFHVGDLDWDTVRNTDTPSYQNKSRVAVPYQYFAGIDVADIGTPPPPPWRIQASCVLKPSITYNIFGFYRNCWHIQVLQTMNTLLRVMNNPLPSTSLTRNPIKLNPKISHSKNGRQMGDWHDTVLVPLKVDISKSSTLTQPYLSIMFYLKKDCS